MKSAQLLQDLTFDPEKPHADALYVDRNGRAIVWTLEPRQMIQAHEVPQSPFYVVVLQGSGWFSGANGQEQRLGPNTLIVFDPGERHFIRADNERLVFVGFLHGASGNVSDKVGGEIGRGHA